MPALMSIGEILVEMTAEQTGQTFLKSGKFQGPFASGAPAICIDQAARLGASCGIIACVGDDDFGLLNIRRLREDGADVSGIVRVNDKATGVAFVTYDSGGGRKFIFHFANAAAGALCPEDVPLEKLSDAQILHIMGCSLSASASLRASVMKGAKYCKDKGARLSFDPNLRPELLGIAEIRESFGWMLDNADILLTGENELAVLFGGGVEDAVAVRLARGTQIIVLKSGSKGARVITAETDETVKPYTVREVDPTGAGDCFDGAFLAMLLEGKTPREAARIANAAGAHSVTRIGPMEGAAFWREIESMMRRDM